MLVGRMMKPRDEEVRGAVAVALLLVPLILSFVMWRLGYLFPSTK
jgi:hypothetical protein